MKGFLSLFKKELKEERGWIIGGVLSILALEIFLYTRIGVWGKGIASGVSLFPLVAIPLLSLIRGYRSFKREWDTTSAIFLLSLPVNRRTILFAKTLVFLILLLLLTFATTISSFIIIHKEIGSLQFVITNEEVKYIQIGLNNGVIFSFIYWVWTFSFGIAAISSYLFTRCVRRLRTLIGFFSFFLFFYLYFRLSSLLSFIPNPKLAIRVAGEVKPIDLPLSGTVSLMILCLVFWVLAGYFLERRVEC